MLLFWIARAMLRICGNRVYANRRLEPGIYAALIEERAQT
jgi:hypothetical protein